VRYLYRELDLTEGRTIGVIIPAQLLEQVEPEPTLFDPQVVPFDLSKPIRKIVVE